MLSRTGLVFLAVAAAAVAGEPAASSIEDFAFVQITDVHVSPHLARSGPPSSLRGAECIRWLCREAVGPQNLEPFGVKTPAPAFGLVTGDLTEYGVIDDTWSIFERAFAELPYPLYVQPGNHDNTWVAMYDVMRARHGGENYSFDAFGCHFVCLCSASPQEPVPTIDAKTRAWLRADLSGIKPGTPVFVALHHPIYSSEFANPAESDTLVDLLGDYNVALLLYGHGHNVEHRQTDGIDGVMGGSTFGKRAGYAVVGVQDGTLRVAYRYHQHPRRDGAPGWRRVFEKKLPRSAPERLFRIVSPAPDGTITGESLDIALAGEGLQSVTVHIDGQEQACEVRTDGPAGTYRASLPKMTPGWHLLTVRVRSAEGGSDLRTRRFRYEPGASPLVWQQSHPAAFKAGPVVGDGVLFVARTDGVVAALDSRTGQQRWVFRTGGELLGTPAWDGQRLVFGSGDGAIYAIDAKGGQLWKHEVGRPVYGVPLIDRGVVYVGDVGGRLHALDLRDGSSRWAFERADYCIESRPCVWGDLVVFGAWDGFLYAIDRATGKLAWKVLGPKSSEGRAARYYAPADCGPVAIGDSLFVCDRGYVLGTFDRAGEAIGQLATGVAGLVPGPERNGILCRHIDDHVSRYDNSGKRVWQQAVSAGRFPIPPTVHGDSIVVCSNTGRLSMLDAKTGRIRSSYQATAGFYVMAPVAVDADSTCYVAGMDGTISAVRFPGG